MSHTVLGTFTYTQARQFSKIINTCVGVVVKMYADLPEKTKQQIYHYLTVVKDFRAAKRLYDTWMKRRVMDSTLANEMTQPES